MEKITITFEDAPNGGVVISGEPSIEALTKQSFIEGPLTGAAKWAAIAWSNVRREGVLAGIFPRGGEWDGIEPMVTTTITLDRAELYELTRYKRASDQLKELHRQGFYRARIVVGHLVLERAHYEAVCRGNIEPARPKVRLLVRSERTAKAASKA